MRISPISVYQNQNLKRNVTANKNGLQKMNQQNPEAQPAFKSLKGLLTGGAIGTSVAGFCALAAFAATPVGWVAGIATLASEVGGAVIGGAIGDKVSGKDEDDE